MSIRAINSFFNLDWEELQMRNLIEKSGVDLNSNIDWKVEEVPSMKEIGTEDYLWGHRYTPDIISMCQEWSLGSTHFNPIRIFESKHCIF